MSRPVIKNWKFFLDCAPAPGNGWGLRDIMSLVEHDEIKKTILVAQLKHQVECASEFILSGLGECRLDPGTWNDGTIRFEMDSYLYWCHYPIHLRGSINLSELMNDPGCPTAVSVRIRVEPVQQLICIPKSLTVSPNSNAV